MPRFGRRYRAPRVPKVPKPPKPPKQPKVARPKTKDLRMVLKGLVTTDIGQRINSLLYVLQWYETAIKYLMFTQKGALTPEQMKSLDRAHKCRLQGQGTTFNDEKETAYRTAIQILEKMLEPTLRQPKIGVFYQQLDSRKPTLEKKTENWMQKFGDTVKMLQAALKPRNSAGEEIEISIGPVTEEVQKDAELRRFVLRPDVAKNIHRKRIREGLLTAVMDQIVMEELARLAAMEKELDQNSSWTGRWLVKPSSQLQASYRMMRNLIEFARTAEAPKRLVRMAVPDISNGQPKAPRPVRVGFGGVRKGPLVDGMFVEGTTAANLYNILKDGKTRTRQELRTTIGKRAILSPLQTIATHVIGKGMKLQMDGEKVTLNLGGQA